MAYERKDGFTYCVYVHGMRRLEDDSMVEAGDESPHVYCAYVVEEYGEDHKEILEDGDFESFGEAYAAGEELARKYDCEVETY